MRSAQLFYVVMLLTFIYSVYKFRGSIFHVFIILLFYDGMFAYAGTTVWNTYKMLLPMLAFYCSLKYNSISVITRHDRPVIVTFILFSLSFLLSSLLNGDYFNLTFSQYSKYVNLFLSFFILKKIVLNTPSFENIRRLVFSLLMIQIILTVVKFYVWGIRESVVGSISERGGAAAAVLPVLGFIFIWVIKRGTLGKKEWLLVALLMFIGFVSMKRAIWFVMPIVVFLFYTYVPRRKLSKRLLLVIPVVPLIFYLGVRYNPTLNPDKSVGGTFDLGYAINYAKEYSFGKDENGEVKGRGGATLALFKKLFSLQYSGNDLFGNGLKPIYAAEAETYNDPGFGIEHRGSATGVYQTSISSGFIGIFATLAFVLNIMFQIRNKRLRNVIIAVFLWEYLFYIGVILRTPALSFLLLFTIFYYNSYSPSKMPGASYNHNPQMR